MLLYTKPVEEEIVSDVIPREAWPVVRILRRDVPRPEELPTRQSQSWDYLRWNNRCPMGLHVLASHHTPGVASQFPLGVDNETVVEFASWWDSQDDPKAAVDAVWPE